MGKPHYYLMKNKKLLRLEAHERWEDLSWLVRSQIFDSSAPAMGQDEANWRVAIFRDDILEIAEYIDYLHSPEAVADSEEWAQAI